MTVDCIPELGSHAAQKTARATAYIASPETMNIAARRK